MTSTFSFGFSGDDIDEEVTTESGDDHAYENQAGLDSRAGLTSEGERYRLEEWIHTLPSQISYNTLTIPYPDGTHTSDVVLGRREIFDIRAQLMAEDEEGNDELISGLETGDIEPDFYEGGFKTWECALDLAKLTATEEAVATGTNRDSRDEEAVHVIELGAGTALPSLALFARLLTRTPQSSRNIQFTLADYNTTVLRLVTLPNILLTWKLNTGQKGDVANALTEAQEKDGEDLEIEPELLEAFRADLATRFITVDFVSGAWSRRLVDLAVESRVHTFQERCRTLILASETIYSPSSLTAFSETLLELLQRCGTATHPGLSSKALVAAKKVYFGVGGGVDEFLAVLLWLAGAAVTVLPRVDVKTEGVGRVVLQVEVPDREQGEPVANGS
ncbi:hypothetical protein Egran_05541 [Elaphomyces granulatus]|uniref:protein-histidine N-methyltransferase n=1 Tax=Elaphomyces granulatus TaxID=519963 RepID=A0A232LRA6_9EURO|nr:hypothetical protein Egran_05541 [Elaphomyces granulatus]